MKKSNVGISSNGLATEINQRIRFALIGYRIPKKKPPFAGSEDTTLSSFIEAPGKSMAAIVQGRVSVMVTLEGVKRKRRAPSMGHEFLNFDELHENTRLFLRRGYAAEIESLMLHYVVERLIHIAKTPLGVCRYLPSLAQLVDLTTEINHTGTDSIDALPAPLPSLVPYVDDLLAEVSLLGLDTDIIERGQTWSQFNEVEL